MRNIADHWSDAVQTAENSQGSKLETLLESAFRGTEELASIGAWCFFPTDKTLWMSLGTNYVHGTCYSPTVCLRKALGVYSAANRRQIIAAARHAWETGSRFRLDLPIVSRSGEVKHVRIAGDKRELAGKLVMFGVIHDTTESVDDRLTTLWLAEHDGMTKTLNRKAFMDLVERTIGRSDNIAVALFDMDDLKIINDTLGHAAGDEAILSTAATIQAAFLDGVVGRLGGDELALIVRRRDQATLVADLSRTMEDLAIPKEINEGTISTGCSAGLAFQAASDDVRSLMKKADAALYHSKRYARGSLTNFSNDVLRKSQNRTKVMDDFRRSIADGKIQAVFQPIVDAQCGEVRAFELLTRIEDHSRHELGAMSLAFENPEISNKIFRKVVSEACRFISQTHLPVQINATFHDVVNANFYEIISRELASFEVNAGQLVIEITESALLHDRTDAAHRAISHLINKGIMFALDDFGTGYSSLTHLMELPISKVKIDRRFVQSSDARCRTIITNIAHMCRSLDLAVVAEGIETHDQAAIAKAAGIEELQGYLFGRPAPSSTWLRELERRPGHTQAFSFKQNA